MSIKLSTAEKKFLNIVVPKAKQIMRVNKLLASITIAQGALESGWGTTELAKEANNIFGIKVNEDWNGPSYSKETKEYYDNKIDAVNVTALFRVYDSFEDSIDDRTNYLLTRKVDSNKYRYRNLIGVTDYKEAANLLVLDGYATDPNYATKLINIIQKYELDRYDKEIMEEMNASDNLYRVRKTWEDKDSQLIAAKVLENAKKVADDNPGYKVFNYNGDMVYDPLMDGDILYRVRLTWDRAETQLIAAKNLNNAKEVAEKHSGYKVFDEQGKIVYDPWKKEDPVEQDPINKVIIPTIGATVILDNIGVYRTSNDKTPFVFLSGKYYFYEDKTYNGRVRITDRLDSIGSCPYHVKGFVRLSDLS